MEIKPYKSTHQIRLDWTWPVYMHQIEYNAEQFLFIAFKNSLNFYRIKNYF